MLTKKRRKEQEVELPDAYETQTQNHWMVLCCGVNVLSALRLYKKTAFLHVTCSAVRINVFGSEVVVIGVACKGSPQRWTLLLSSACEARARALWQHVQEYTNEAWELRQVRCRKAWSITWQTMKQEETKKCSSLASWMCFTIGLTQNSLNQIRYLNVRLRYVQLMATIENNYCGTNTRFFLLPQSSKAKHTKHCFMGNLPQLTNRWQVLSHIKHNRLTHNNVDKHIHSYDRLIMKVGDKTETHVACAISS